jgi:hypothetical protein
MALALITAALPSCGDAPPGQALQAGSGGDQKVPDGSVFDLSPGPAEPPAKDGGTDQQALPADASSDRMAGSRDRASLALDGAVAAPGRQRYPRTLHTTEQIAFVRDQITRKVEPFASAHKQFLVLGAAAGRRSTISAVPDFMAPSRDEDKSAHDRARALIGMDAEAAYLLALAARIGIGLDQNQGRAYVQKAAQIVREWARVNVSFSGTDGDYLMVNRGLGLAFAADLLWDDPIWSDADRVATQIWLRNVLEKAALSLEKKPGRTAWGLLAALAAHGLLDDWAAVDQDIARLSSLIDEGIRPDGGMPAELARGDRSLLSTFDVLVSLTASVEVARNLRGIDLYSWTPPDGGTVKKALDFFFKRGCLEPEKWPIPNQSARMYPDSNGGNLIAAMGFAYGDRAYLAWVKHPIWYPINGMPWALPSLMAPRR